MTQSSRHGQIFSERRQNKRTNSRVATYTAKVPDGSGSVWLDPVIDDTITTPPGSPTRGDRYVVPCGATGAWAGHVGDITEWDGAAWVFTTPLPGTTVWVQSRNYFTTFAEIPGLAGPVADSDITTWLPHHLLDASHAEWNYPVLSILDTPPGSPGMFDSYLVDNTPTGAWVGHTDQIAVYVCDTITEAGAWVFLDPVDGQLVWNVAEEIFYVFDGDTFIPLSDTIDLAFNDLIDVDVAGSPDNSLVQYNSGTGMWEDISVTDLASQIKLNDLGDVDDTAATNGQWLRKISDTGAPNDYQFDSITSDDVGNDSNVPGATVTDALNNLDADITNIDGRVTTLEGAGSGVQYLNDLLDVHTGSPGAGEDGYVVAWDNGTSRYTLQSSGGGGGGGSTTTNGECSTAIFEYVDTTLPDSNTYDIGTVPMLANSAYTVQIDAAIVYTGLSAASISLTTGWYKAASVVYSASADEYTYPAGYSGPFTIATAATGDGTTGFRIIGSFPGITGTVRCVVCVHMTRVSL